jgi:plasmid replication initiation protein
LCLWILSLLFSWFMIGIVLYSMTLSSYSIRLYEMLIQWKSVGSTEIEVDELRQLWVLENKYPAMCDLKKRVIEPVDWWHPSCFRLC